MTIHSDLDTAGLACNSRKLAPTHENPLLASDERDPGYVTGGHHDLKNPPEITYADIRMLAGDTCHRQILEKYYSHPFSIARCMIALNANASQSLLLSLAMDEDASVRGCAASNPVCDPKAAEIMSRDEHPVARAGAARHPGLSEETMHRLAEDSNSQVKNAIRQNQAYLRLIESRLCG
jgi:hypothetical protein